jgi:hypothetical protein
MDAMGDTGVVLDGPTEFPTMKNYVSFNNEGYVDDKLTEHQEDIICGVYRIVPSTFGSMRS